MANPETARQIASLLNKVAKYSVGLGIAGSIAQTSLFTGMLNRCRDFQDLTPKYSPPPYILTVLPLPPTPSTSYSRWW